MQVFEINSNQEERPGCVTQVSSFMKALVARLKNPF